MGRILRRVWALKTNFIVLWLFFAVLGLTWDKRVIELVGVVILAGIFSVLILILCILFVDSGWYKKGN